MLLIAAWLSLGARPASAQSLVSSTADSGQGSLRAIAAGASAGVTIRFAPELSGQAIVLTSGQLLLSKDVTIDAASLPAGIRIDGNHSSRIFEVASGVTTVMSGLTLVNGRASAGGAILNQGNVTLNRCTLARNAATSGGGGGGLYNKLGMATLNECTVTENSATAGGGLFNLSGGNPIVLNQCTVSGNTAASGGGVDAFNLGPADISTLSLFNTILAGNTATSGSDVTGISISKSGVNIVGGDPILASLDNHGGPTPTMPPLPGSPAINAGDDSASTLFTIDQRGFPRRSGSHVDVGAVELQSPVVTTAADSGPGSLRTVATQPMEMGGAIGFAPSLSGQTILLTSGEITLGGTMGIDASALPAGVTVSALNTSRIFNVAGGANVMLHSLTLARGSTPNSGGAIYTAAGSTLRLVRCTVTGSTALEGGALLNDGVLQAENCTFSGNNGGYGGALQCRAPATLVNCTVASNNASWGGGIFNKYSTLTMNNSIIANNTALFDGGDILNQLAALVYVNVNLVRSVAVDRPSAPDAGPAPLGGDPLLAPLGSYGGPTPTMPPLLGSPAIDAGGPGTLATDQRGLPRVLGPAPDLGAAEYALDDPTVTTAADTGPGSLRYAVVYSRPGATVSFASDLSGATVGLTNGTLLLDRDVALDASSLVQRLRIDGMGKRLFQVP
ncbi:MAG TPA: hypothetical protein DCM86_01150, partial [Verrucomicrobiales bacterium]|nr:hypothetical protein [Verrucomicrobiales bacterium]